MRHIEHLSDGQLMRLVDGESTEHHVFECELCRARLDRLRARSDRFDSLLKADSSQTAAAVPIRRSVAPAAWALAAVLVLAAVSIASPGARGAIIQAGEWVWDSGDRTQGAEVIRAEVQFRPMSDTVAIRFLQRQEAGRLVLVAGPAEHATLVANTNVGVAFLIDGGKLLVKNRLDELIDYHLTMPSSATHLLFRIGDEPARLLIAPEWGRQARLELNR